MTALPKKKYISPEEYLAMERNSLERHEYRNGKIFQTASSNLKHSAVTGNVAIVLHSQLKKRDCRVLQVNMLVHIPKTGFFVYPNVLVVCGKPELIADGYFDNLLNPILIVEVLSSSRRLRQRREV